VPFTRPFGSKFRKDRVQILAASREKPRRGTFDGCPNDPYHPVSMPIYQTAARRMVRKTRKTVLCRQLQFENCHLKDTVFFLCYIS